MSIQKFDIKKYDSILARGLSCGLGETGGLMCIEAAICMTLGLPHGDDPGCVADSVRVFKISLNDKKWSSPEARAAGLRDLWLAQLGSLGVVSDAEFVSKLAEKIIRVLIPKLFRQAFPNNKQCLAAAGKCETEGTKNAASDAARAAARAARASSYAADAASSAVVDEYLTIVAALALEVLRELQSPGIQLLKDES